MSEAELQKIELATQVRNLQKQKKPLPQITQLQKQVKELQLEVKSQSHFEGIIAEKNKDMDKLNQKLQSARADAHSYLQKIA